jgi:hypothetical protein
VVASQESETVQAPQEIAPVIQESSEEIAWKFFISKGYTPIQTAGILGNLKQEHNFNTDGDGIAQWTGARLEQLKQRGNYRDLTVQLNFIIEELNGTESVADKLLRSSYSVEEATIKFQNTYERCGDCRQSQRIAYALAFYNQFR